MGSEPRHAPLKGATLLGRYFTDSTVSTWDVPTRSRHNIEIVVEQIGVHVQRHRLHTGQSYAPQQNEGLA